MQIVIKPYMSNLGEGNDLTSVRLRLEVEETIDIDRFVFVHERFSINTGSGVTNNNRFIAVAKPSDLATYPVGSPSTDPSLPQFFRMDMMDMYFRSPDLLYECFESIQTDLNSLVRAMSRLNDIHELDSIIIDGN